MLRPFEAAAAASARPAGGARARKTKRLAWDASTLRAGSEERAGGSVGRVRELPYGRKKGGVEHDVVQVEAATVAGVLGSGGGISASCARIIVWLICAFDESRTWHVEKSLSPGKNAREPDPHLAREFLEVEAMRIRSVNGLATPDSHRGQSE